MGNGKRYVGRNDRHGENGNNHFLTLIAQCRSEDGMARSPRASFQAKWCFVLLRKTFTERQMVVASV